ncbi:hypothetical protein I6A60_00405 [Frankia sp. AgB1.9]|uniref:hypothetical protein n=1 Tax=unclassified Frankia TaxID=2632575 RepID=UPI0019324176|nr:MULTISPECIES: hypothetical protein [unclassified Frankia]MBL7487341.1 hypothetical protein [Frankia sp. AgW1.1]MBL7546349.1 hypothetical protein [Frankia sp. AgB1.9]MBL7618605.1 hypothetical protein [Frankia sp. AgB1.8]
MTSSGDATEPDDVTAARIRDVHHLLELLDLLPVPDLEKKGHFWNEFAVAEAGDRAKPDPHYIVGKLASWIQDVNDEPGDAERARRLASYCLHFFDKQGPAVGDVLRGCVDGGEATGQRLAQSICEVAWRIYVPIVAAMNRENDPLRRRQNMIWQLRQTGASGDGGV